MDIRILPSNIADMIAAGEVVQRPASVVKELMENAVDAGADKISVIIRDAGRTLVQVIDNGCGMTPDEAVLCFQRHATSKIVSAEDLQKIETYGFRGEALASIAAVAEVTLKTRRSQDDVATQVTITDASGDAPGRQDISRTAAPIGSNFAVRNLFYNTPARRKFLKSDASEMKALTSEFIRIALARKDISFSLTVDGREIFRLPPATLLKFRIRDIAGSSAVENLVPVEVTTSAVSVRGFISRPESARKNASNQFFFVNGRYFRSPYLHKAVMKAYENLLPDGYAPSYFIFLELDPAAMDVNVHPTKTEIKFEDDNVLFTVLNACTRESLGRNAFDDKIDFERGSLPQFHSVGDAVGEYRQISEPPVCSGAGFNPFDGDGFANRSEWEVESHGVSHYGSGSYASGKGLSQRGLSALFDNVSADGVGGQAEEPRPVLVSGHFALAAGQTGVVLVDMSRAMQRIMFERFTGALLREAPVAQRTLFPTEVEVGMENMPLLSANSALLRSLGFELEPFSGNSVVVNALPESLPDDKASVTAMIYELVTALQDEAASIAGALYSPLAEKLAKSAARRVSLPSDACSARLLLDALFACENPGYTPDGRKVTTVLKQDDLETSLK